MAKKKERYANSDLVAGRNAMPGSRPQKPAEDYVITMPSTGERIGGTRMNFAGVAGGLPNSSSSILRQRAEAYKAEGATDSARAARIRARNVDEHVDATAKAKKEIKLRKLKADAEKSGASGFAKSRYKAAKETGMYAKGGSVSASRRGDGIARKGKTRGKVC
jgi:hypothetical protein